MEKLEECVHCPLCGPRGGRDVGYNVVENGVVKLSCGTGVVTRGSIRMEGISQGCYVVFPEQCPVLRVVRQQQNNG